MPPAALAEAPPAATADSFSSRGTLLEALLHVEALSRARAADGSRRFTSALSTACTML